MQTSLNPDVHKNIFKAPCPCWRCQHENVILLQHGTLAEPMRGDIVSRYCAQCFAIYPSDAHSAKKAMSYKQRGARR